MGNTNKINTLVKFNPYLLLILKYEEITAGRQ